MLLNNGDTLNGFIENITGRNSPRNILFSSTPEGNQPVSYSPAEVKWFRFKGGEWYFGFIGQIESSSLNQIDITADSAMHTISDTMFIRAVLLSRASLFYARDRKDRIHLFIQKNNSAIMELAYKKYYIDEIVIADYRNKITRKTIMGNEMYKGQLINAFADCRYLSASILSRFLPYAKNDLMNLFEEYNKCRGEKIFYKEPSDRGKVNLTFAGGATLTGVTPYSSMNTAWQGIDFKNSVGYQVAAGINWTFPRMDEKWAWYNEAALRFNSLSGSQSQPVATVYEINMLYARFNSMIRFQVPAQKVKPYIGFGLSNSFLIYFNGTQSPEIEAVSIIDTYRTYEQGILLGTGININHLYLEMRIEKSNGWSNFSDFSTKFTTGYLQAGYTF